jgi:NAD(P)-dependent dehydrogenase (short-subunit alcohol dehydrogenase family)
MKISFINQNIIIVGPGHLGMPILQKLLELKANIILIGRKNTCVSKKVHFYQCDLLDENELHKILKIINKKFNYINGLVYLASQGSLGSVEYIEKKDFDISFNINVIVPFIIIKNLLTLFLKGSKKFNSNSSVIITSSVYGKTVPDENIYKNKKFVNPINYGAAKAAAAHLIKYFSSVQKYNQIRFNCLIPGAFPNENIKFKKSIIKKKLINRISLKRFGKKDELVGPVIFLLSNLSSYVNGSELVVDGGFLKS